MTIKFSKMDLEAIASQDADYLHYKGSKCRRDGLEDSAFVYFHLGAGLGHAPSILEIGVAYLYGRGVAADFSLAKAYLTLASRLGVVDASYELGYIHASDRWGVKDAEAILYYYLKAANQLGLRTDVVWNTEFQKYPDLAYALGKEYAQGGQFPNDSEKAFGLLQHADIGYLRMVRAGDTDAEKKLEEVEALMDSPQFKEQRDKYGYLFEEIGIDDDLPF